MTICIFGDSIAWGAYDCGKGGWADRLKSLLLNDILIYNLGVSDEDTKTLLKRFDFEASSRKPDIVIFAIGINDSFSLNGEKAVPPEEFSENISLLFEKARKFTDKIAFVGPTKVNEALTTPWPSGATGEEIYDNRSILEYNEIIQSFCEEKDIIFVDVFDLLTDSDLCDGLHPNASGHQKMFEAIKNELEPLWKM